MGKTCVKGTLGGVIAVVGCVALSVWVLYLYHLDLRAIIGYFPLISLTVILFVFAVAFRWQYLRSSRRR